MMEPKLKILILLNYFERPNLVKGFLRSLLASDRYHDNWNLAFIDDGSTEPGKPIVERILKDHLHKIKFYNSNMTQEMKSICGGSYMGKFMNDALKESDADIAIMAGDDDEIYPDYLKNLNTYFLKNPKILSCYSSVHVFNPLKEKSCDAYNLYCEDPTWKGHAWFGKPINGAYKIDGIQLAWRLECNRLYGTKFSYPISINHDAIYLGDLYERCGECHYTGFIAQYKGRHDGQLIRRIESGGGAFGEKKPVLDKPKDVLFL